MEEEREDIHTHRVHSHGILGTVVRGDHQEVNKTLVEPSRIRSKVTAEGVQWLGLPLGLKTSRNGVLSRHNQ